jgi:hypothetical protein
MRPMADDGEPEFNLAEMFPDGRMLFYEGDDPDGFRAEIIAECGFDPADRPGYFSWPDGDWTPLDWDQHRAFSCPPEHLEAIDGRHRRWPIGT